ncbi:MAG: hypothetical protein ABSB49_15365 [Polyangia bacterium]|jgi:hypothetical protein
MINGKYYSDHALFFVEAPADFEHWWNNVYRPWVDGAEDYALMIAGVADEIEPREPPPYTLAPAGEGWGGDLRKYEDPPTYKLSTMPVVKFLKSSALEQKRDGKPRPRYRLEK